jgi:cytochrome c biogenesis protein CcmG/thiol:disulfide interchange protein DsbE
MRHVRFALVPLVVLPVAWLMFQGLGRDPREIPSPLVGRPAPDFTLQSMNGEEISLADYRGRPVLVNFWASWCFECIEEHRVLMDAQARYGDEFAIIGILWQDTVPDARRFLLRYGDGGWPNLIDPGGRVAIDFGVTGPPESFFVAADGMVRYRQWGPVTDEGIEGQLPPLLDAAHALERSAAPAGSDLPAHADNDERGTQEDE